MQPTGSDGFVCVGVWLGLGVMLTDLWYFDMEFNLISRMCVCVCLCVALARSFVNRLVVF